MSYGGLVLDLLAAPLLLWRRTRMSMFVLLVLFHLANCAIFSIGVFPWLMIAVTTVFFEPDWPRRLVRRFWRRAEARPATGTPPIRPARRRWVLAALAAYTSLQVLIPLRHLLYPGNVNWTEEGHRFSWRMKLRTKDGWARFTARDPNTGRVWAINPALPKSRWLPGGEGEGPYLTDRQLGKMPGLPDMVLQFSHHLADLFRGAGYPMVEIRARVKTSLNGRDPPELLVDPEIDLAAEPRSLLPARWILPLREPLRR